MWRGGETKKTRPLNVHLVRGRLKNKTSTESFFFFSFFFEPRQFRTMKRSLDFCLCARVEMCCALIPTGLFP